ncbi:MAG TPA: AcvB/VirJ family lysyl-phosphatidylglycerol hydrolase [Terriglobales bacterium]|nr:AcvB/VirJ family lysyl-phosphatidylglycerol hydrolase [Terriglobales bacterium]
MAAFTRLVTIGALLLLDGAVYAELPKAGKNELTVRAHSQEIDFYPAASPGEHRTVLFVPGDGGCRGFAITITEELAKAGYDAFCLDTRRYLGSFTGKQVLSPKEIASDFGAIARWVQQGKRESTLLVGWSEGAGLGLAAMAEPPNQAIFDGLVAISTPEVNILAWHWTDIGASITHRPPHEPSFSSAEFVARVSPRPLFLIASTSDDYVSTEATRALFSRARAPKRLSIINARDHKYSGNTNAFFGALREALNWIEQQHP